MSRCPMVVHRTLRKTYRVEVVINHAAGNRAAAAGNTNLEARLLEAHCAEFGLAVARFYRIKPTAVLIHVTQEA